MSAPPETPTLLPCPFCGGPGTQDGGWTFCLKCGVGYEDDERGTRWNRRAPDPVRDQLREAPSLLRDAVASIEGLLQLARLVGHIQRDDPTRYNTSGQVLIHGDQKRDCASAIHLGDAVLARLRAALALGETTNG